MDEGELLAVYFLGDLSEGQGGGTANVYGRDSRVSGRVCARVSGQVGCRVGA